MKLYCTYGKKPQGMLLAIVEAPLLSVPDITPCGDSDALTTSHNLPDCSPPKLGPCGRSPRTREGFEYRAPESRASPREVPGPSVARTCRPGDPGLNIAPQPCIPVTLKASRHVASCPAQKAGSHLGHAYQAGVSHHGTTKKQNKRSPAKVSEP